MFPPEKRLIILSGKGGVGKTTLSLAIAMKAAAAGRRTLICEVGENEKIAPMFGRSSVGYREEPLAENLNAIYINPDESFNEFVRRTLKIEALWKPVVESKLIRSFISAAPGIKELMTLGKIMDLERTTGKDKRPRYDLVILDAPATGHGLTLFKVPFVAMRASRAGPLYKNAKLVADLLQDPMRTIFYVVTLAEEMPVNESLEMIASIESDLRIPLGGLLANALHPPVLEGQAATLAAMLRDAPQGPLKECLGGMSPASLAATASRMESRHRLNRSHLAALREKTRLPVHEIPFIFDSPWGLGSIRRIAEAIG